jgi:hypothetical protein
MATTPDGKKYNVRLSRVDDKRLESLRDRITKGQFREYGYRWGGTTISDVFRSGLETLERRLDKDDFDRAEREAADRAAEAAAAKPAKKGRKPKQT